MEPEQPLPAGTYEVMVIDASGDSESMSLEFLITAGAHKGGIMRLLAEGEDRADFDLLGLPARLTFDDAEGPSVHWQ